MLLDLRADRRSTTIDTPIRRRTQGRLGPAAGVFSMDRSPWSLGITKSDRLLAPCVTAALALVVAMGSGCTATPRLTQMIPINIAPCQPTRASVSLAVNDSLESYPDDGFGKTVPRQTYMEAVGRSLLDSGLFARIAPQDEADYHLEVTVFWVRLNVVDKSFGYVLAYDVTADWKLTKAKNPEPIFHEEVKGTGRANFGDAFNGLTRNTIARERGAQASIVEGIKRLCKVPL